MAGPNKLVLEESFFFFFLPLRCLMSKKWYKITATSHKLTLLLMFVIPWKEISFGLMQTAEEFSLPVAWSVTWFGP